MSLHWLRYSDPLANWRRCCHQSKASLVISFFYLVIETLKKIITKKEYLYSMQIWNGYIHKCHQQGVIYKWKFRDIYVKISKKIIRLTNDFQRYGEIWGDRIEERRSRREGIPLNIISLYVLECTILGKFVSWRIKEELLNQVS